MAKLTLAAIVADYGSKQLFNDNFDLIEAAIENTLSRDGTAPNYMDADLDMNSYEIVNVADATTATSAINRNYAEAHYGGAAVASAEAAQAAAETAQAAAETAQTAAETAQSAAETVYDTFDDRFLGAKASAPSTDNDGNPLVTGAMYWNTTTNYMYVWDGTSWHGLSDYDVCGGVQGVADASTAITTFVAVRTFTFPTNLSGSKGTVGTNPATASIALSVKRNGTTFATITISTGGVFTFATTSTPTFVAGDVLTVVTPASLDSAADIYYTLKGILG